MAELAVVSEELKQNIERAVRILKEEGCKDIFLFGSAATGRVHTQSDIDLAVHGCPPDLFFIRWAG